MTAYIIGLKAGAAIGVCAGFEHYSAGWHGTSTIGRMASAAGCARLLGLDEQQTVYALGIAGTQASGLKRVFGTMCKPYHAGKKAPKTGLEGKFSIHYCAANALLRDIPAYRPLPMKK